MEISQFIIEENDGTIYQITQPETSSYINGA